MRKRFFVCGVIYDLDIAFFMKRSLCNVQKNSTPRSNENKLKKESFESFDLKKEEDAEDGGKANEDEGGKGETDSFQRALRDCKGEHPTLVWLEKVLQCFNCLGIYIY